MRSLYDDVFDTLTAHAAADLFSIANVNIRKPFDESPKVYPLIVVHEPVNIPQSHATVTGEGRTTLAYQADINTQDCVDTDGDVVSAFDAGRALLSEVSDLLDTTYNITRISAHLGPSPAPDVVSHIWRGGCVLDSSGYSYRK